MPIGVYPRQVRPIKDRFLIKVTKTKTCWIWTAYLNKRGYGEIQMGRTGMNKGAMLAHRLSYELFKGPIKNGFFVLHKCDNRRCVNPKHLLLGTLQDNNLDMRLKGRHAKGSRMGSAKVTEMQVLNMRRLSKKGCSGKELCKIFKLSPGTVSEILSRKLWKHI